MYVIRGRRKFPVHFGHVEKIGIRERKEVGNLRVRQRGMNAIYTPGLHQHRYIFFSFIAYCMAS